MKSYRLKLNPLQILEALKDGQNCFFLDSSLISGASGRYSFIGIDPYYVLSAQGQEPFSELKDIFSSLSLSIPKCEIPFLGGAVGYLAYEVGHILEKKIHRRLKPDSGMPDCFFGFYNAVIIIDNLKRMLYILSVGFPEKKYHLAKALCETNFKKMHGLLLKAAEQACNNKNQPLRSQKQLTSNFKKEEYLLSVKKAKEYIKKGDIYQVNLSQRFDSQTNLPGTEIYRRLRNISPTHFSCYYNAGDFQIMSSSPERFLKVDTQGVVTTSPMKGTRPRSKNKLKDKELRKALLESKKDRAELIMIVDLERNDLGRVCDYGSIKVKTLRQVEAYNTVFQTTATVEGKLHKTKDRIDLLRACFPGGSITGCPKIRAMQIIEELEPTRRSLYTGSLGYLSFSGAMDFNILIRTILKRQDRLYFGVGGGIVADSQPEAEYQETLVKAKGILEAIGTPMQSIGRLSPSQQMWGRP